MDFNAQIPTIEKKIGYVFRDKSLLRQAFTRSSYANENKGKGGVKLQSNEVLEFFGDSVLSAAIVTLLMKDYTERYSYGISTDFTEGDFSNIKSRLSDKKNLSLATEKLGLQGFLLLGEGDARQGIENEPSVMEDLFESIVGAIYIDSGSLKAVISSVAKMLEVKEYLHSKTTAIQSAKNLLQEFCADKKRRMPPPVYKTISESGPDHKKLYERACFIGDEIFGIGKGKNHKIADAMAAEDALARLKATETKKALKEQTKIPEESVLQKLKEYATKNKLPSPEFKDLGETDTSNPEMCEYAVECRFAGKSSTGTGVGKREAKLVAADKMLSLLTKEQKEQKKPKIRKQPTGKAEKPQVKKPIAKKQKASPHKKQQNKKVKIT